MGGEEHSNMTVIDFALCDVVTILSSPGDTCSR